MSVVKDQMLFAADIHRLVLAELADYDPARFVRSEHGLDRGGTIADVIVVDDQFHGIEIKSERDSLVRLRPPGGNQIRDYSAVFDRVTVVTAGKHVNGLQASVPSWWGITVCEHTSFGGLETWRGGSPNPSVDPTALARLLWAAELLPLATRLGITSVTGYKPSERIATKRAPKRLLITSIAAAMPLDDLRAEVRSATRCRDYRRERLERVPCVVHDRAGNLMVAR